MSTLSFAATHQMVPTCVLISNSQTSARNQNCDPLLTTDSRRARIKGNVGPYSECLVSSRTTLGTRRLMVNVADDSGIALGN